MNAMQREIVDLLKKSGSKFVRKAGKGGEVWRLPNGMTFVTQTNRTNEHGVTHQLADLRRKLGDVVVDDLIKASRKREQCEHRWERRGAALFCTRCSDIQTVSEQEQEQQPKEEQKMEPLKVVKNEQQEKKPDTYKKHWTKAQDRALIEAYGARMTPDEIAILLQDIRPGVTGVMVKQRAASLRAHMRALKGEPPPGKGKGVHGGPGVVPIEQTTGSAGVAPIVPANVPPMPESVLPLAQKFPALDALPRRQTLARVTFEINGKVRVVDVDEATARKMLQEALTL